MYVLIYFVNQDFFHTSKARFGYVYSKVGLTSNNEKQYKFESKFLFNEKFRNCVYLFTSTLPDYVAQDITKEF